MAIISIKDIIRQYNSVIKSFMDQGYIISPITMCGGYYHADGYTDLVNLNDKKSFIRIFVIMCEYCSDGSYYDSKSYKYSITKILAKKYEFDGKFKPISARPDCGKLISEKCFYQIKENYLYADTLDDLKQIREIQRKRKESRRVVSDIKSYPINKLSAEFIDSIMERINSIRGFKRATASCIESVCSYQCVDRQNSAKAKFSGVVKFNFNNRCGRIVLN